MKSILTSILFLFFVSMALAQEEASIPIIEVQGYSDRAIAPDEAIFTITLEEKSMRVNDAVDVLKQKTENLAKELKRNKIKDYKLVADNFSVDLNRVYRKGESRDSGYVARQTLRIITNSKNEDLQGIVESIQDAGDMSFNLHFQISENTRKSIDNALLTEALQDAQERSRLIATALGLRSLTVHKVQIVGQSAGGPRMMMAAAASDSPEMMINPDDQKISKRVLIKYTY
ncbi:SIMPL domain-containing protein [Algoriphagus sediminis]|uniref:SIMPL domain-containing protein n=1 Tax=Algoriphagus sediminis TaxID=3057113 RepID=A0ABT7Y846_9BACT|nr:SIMPL domain-containing protein [Algoriphagus sediminis]MDN3202682.1 SIMPL domain-containing protein [Algoriphagus sediminis]